MNKKEKGAGELLGLLKTHPGLVHALIFNPTRVKRLLRNRKARQQFRGVDTTKILSRVSAPGGGGPVLTCVQSTKLLCASGTGANTGYKAIAPKPPKPPKRRGG
jgi:hypothetical protein